MKAYTTKGSVTCCTLLAFIFTVLNSCSVLGQVEQKQVLTKEQYSLWSSLQANAISDNGRWTSYSVHYESGIDTLFVSATEGAKRFSYPKGSKATFSGSEWFACLKDKNRLVILSLTTGEEQIIDNVVDFEFSADGRNLVWVQKKVGRLQDLGIIELGHKNVTQLNNVGVFSFKDDFSALAYSNEREGSSTLRIISLNDQLLPLTTLQLNDNVSRIVWQNNGKSIAFALHPSKSSATSAAADIQLGYYVLDQKKMYILDPKGTPGFPKDKRIVFNSASQLNISEDGLRILFQLVPIVMTELYSAPDVEIWHGDDSRIYTERKMNGNPKDKAKPWVWYPQTDTLLDFMPHETSVLLSGNQKLALSSNTESCGPQFKYDADRDYYLTDLTNGSRKLILPCHSGHSLYTFMSPSGKYIAYFKDGNWFSYDISNNIHRNLTKDAGVAFYDQNDDKAGAPDVYIFAGWTKDDTHIIVYDQYDLWQISTDGTSTKRLTAGRAEAIEYRLASKNIRKKPHAFFAVQDPTVIDLNTPLLLEASSSMESKQGYFMLEKGKVTPLVFDSKNIYMLLQSALKDCFVYIEETYALAPRLIFKKHKKQKAKIIFQSNPQQAKYFWGSNRTITYSNKSGKKLNGLLYYPTDYVEGRKYPMIVQVYERQHYLKNRYIQPSLNNGDGINITNYVMDGYFVLLPDIVYEVGSPGDSALDCVSAAVQEVQKLGIVDLARIGLTGHSLGGYETTYIIAKSKLFAVAVGGASQTDLVSCYLTVGEAYKRPEFWRFEDYTNRMGKMLFEDMDNYIYNSPVFNASTITTPLLLWTGDKDGIVAPKQSMELYLALRRLGKKVALLRYRDEYHSLSDSRKQVDLTLKIADWFNYYLKEGSPKLWMEANANP